MKIISLDPRSKLVYASMYIKGLNDHFGINNVCFSSDPFVDLNQSDDIDDFDHYFSFYNHKTSKRYVVDYRDKSTLNQNALTWCDVYAKVNLNTEHILLEILDPSLHQKIISVGPNFGIKIYDDFSLYFNAIRNYFKSISRLSMPVNFRTFLIGYNWMRKRQNLAYYETVATKSNYVFHVSRFYKNQAHGSTANYLRAAFIRACKNIKEVEFEGGLVVGKDLVNDVAFSDVIINSFVKNSDYVLKTKQSQVLFNTPAAWGCHGWKLGEYFAMGKAIISMPFINNIPEGIQHGVNIHMVNTVEEIENAITSILKDSSYREKLESGSKKYYEEYLKPKSVISRILDHK